MSSALRSGPIGLDATPFRGGATWAMGRSGDVLAMLVVGHIGHEDLLAMSRALGELHDGKARVVLDLSRLDDGGLRFAVAELARRQLARLDVGLVRDIALIVPSGLAGALVLGWLTLGPVPLPVTLHAARDSASCERTRLVFERLDTHVRGQAWRGQLRALLDADPSLDTAELACQLGTSTRSLQRRLDEVGTSFRAERLRARMELAIERVVASHDKIGAIARATGFASESRFCHAFRTFTGAAPSAMRKHVHAVSP